MRTLVLWEEELNLHIQAWNITLAFMSHSDQSKWGTQRGSVSSWKPLRSHLEWNCLPVCALMQVSYCFHHWPTMMSWRTCSVTMDRSVPVLQGLMGLNFCLAPPFWLHAYLSHATDSLWSEAMFVTAIMQTHLKGRVRALKMKWLIKPCFNQTQTQLWPIKV